MKILVTDTKESPVAQYEITYTKLSSIIPEAEWGEFLRLAGDLHFLAWRVARKQRFDKKWLETEVDKVCTMLKGSL